jgi:hypothetical protein
MLILVASPPLGIGAYLEQREDHAISMQSACNQHAIRGNQRARAP